MLSWDEHDEIRRGATVTTDLHNRTTSKRHASGKHRNTRKLSAVAEDLRAQPMFARCTRADVEALLRAGSPTVIPGQWAFLQESTPADAAYLLLDGTARVYRHGVPVAVLDAGDVVGETALLNGTLRNATVSSIAPLKALRIEHTRFNEVLRRRPNIREAFHEIAAARLAPS
jgi:CRP/FNR family transcriptional regulator, cyclic AMP receptor protein